MKSIDAAQEYTPDPAAIFAASLSLWEACKRRAAEDPNLNLSDCYAGMDGLMREVVRIATLFEEWACRHAEFRKLDDVWPYMLEDHFGKGVLAAFFPTGLEEFNERDCLRVALRLRVPLRLKSDLPFPVDFCVSNPIAGSGFKKLQIRSVWESHSDDDGEVMKMTYEDDPYDEEFTSPRYGLYGVQGDGLCEHIADRSSYLEAVALAEKLAPGVQFPTTLIYRDSSENRPEGSPSAG